MVTDVFILNFFADSPCKEEWRVLLQASPCRRRRCRYAVRFALVPDPGHAWAAASVCGSPATALPWPANMYCLRPVPPAYCTALQYLAELDETQKREGAAALPFGKPLQQVSASELGFAGARLDALVSCP